MSATYKPILWNKQKRQYDWTMLALIALYLAAFIGVSLALYGDRITSETLIIRATGSLAIVMLHIILMIGPLARLNKKFLPLLYNRRHLGVSMFLVALIHGVFSILQFHSMGDTNALVSLFISNTYYDELIRFPFQVLGFYALIILFLMAATSHDFWLHHLSPKIWKTLHMFVYLAYAMLIFHVVLGVFELDKSPIAVLFIFLGMLLVIGLHLVADYRQRNIGKLEKAIEKEGFVKIGSPDDIEDNRAKLVQINNQSIAVFKYDGKLSAINNFCKHQNGPLSEGKFVDGCITCPWHGYQYLAHNGSSPPPFTEKVSTYHLKLVDGQIWVNPNPEPEGTAIDPVLLD